MNEAQQTLASQVANTSSLKLTDVISQINSNKKKFVAIFLGGAAATYFIMRKLNKPDTTRFNTDSDDEDMEIEIVS